VSAYRQAIRDGERAGVSHATDPQVMAMFLDTTAQILLGAVSPELIWNGAQARGLTALQLTRLVHHDPDAARDLMWPG
jgi:hypothetical protein